LSKAMRLMVFVRHAFCCVLIWYSVPFNFTETLRLETPAADPKVLMYTLVTVPSNPISRSCGFNTNPSDRFSRNRGKCTCAHPSGPPSMYVNELCSHSLLYSGRGSASRALQ